MKSFCAQVTTFLLSALQILEVSSLHVAITPEHAHVSTNSSTVTALCSTTGSLVGCQFSWLDSLDISDNLLDLSDGLASEMNSSNLNKHLYNYSYAGRGLEEGDCGITLNIQGEVFWVVGCRVREANDGWSYAWMDLIVSDHVSPPVELTPREGLAFLGDSVHISVQSQHPLSFCNFRVPGFPGEFISDGSNHQEGGASHDFRDTNLTGGACSITLHNISEISNGPIVTKLREPSSWKYVISSLLVASPPSTHTLNISYNEAQLSANCIVGPCRPAAKITWLLDDLVIRQDANDDSPVTNSDAWRWPWDDSSTSQTLTLQGESGVQGRQQQLTCRVDHVALPEPFQISETIVLKVADECQGETTCVTTQECVQRIPGSEPFLFYYSRCGPDQGNVCCPAPPEPLATHSSTSDSSCLLPEDCGFTFYSRIIGGAQASLGQFPWMALLAYEHIPNSSKTEFLCSGTLITSQYVLTAAHCTNLKTAGDPVSVRLGENDLRADPDCDIVDGFCADAHVNIDVERVIAHEEFNHRNLKNDIALVRLKSKVEISDWISPICLPFNYEVLQEEDEEEVESKNYTAAGWGKSQYDNTAGTHDLQFVPLHGALTFDCSEIQTSEVQPLDWRTQVCAGGEVGKDTCKGDSGGPLMEVIPNVSRTYLIGITSFGTHPCGSWVPSVFTRVTGYLDWIISNLEK